jgi:hypothetical protein
MKAIKIIETININTLTPWTESLELLQITTDLSVLFANHNCRASLRLSNIVIVGLNFTPGYACVCAFSVFMLPYVGRGHATGRCSDKEAVPGVCRQDSKTCKSGGLGLHWCAVP